MLARKADLQALRGVDCIDAHRSALDVTQVILPARAATLPCEASLRWRRALSGALKCHYSRK